MNPALAEQRISMNSAPVGIDPQNKPVDSSGSPYNLESFTQMGVMDVWQKYAQILTWGQGQTLAILDDGCDISVPQWQVQMPWGPKVIATYNTVEGGINCAPRPPAYHGTSVGYPSSLNHAGLLGIAYNNQVAHVRCVTIVHLPKDESSTIASALQWVLDHQEQYGITTVNLAPVDNRAHSEPLLTVIDEKLRLLRARNIWVSAPCANNGFTDGISWPACASYCFAIGATIPGKREVHLDRFTNTDLLVAAQATSSANTYAAACSMILREAIEKAAYEWRDDANNLPDAMMKIFQQTAVPIHDPACGYTYHELDLLAAVDFVFEKGKA